MHALVKTTIHNVGINLKKLEEKNRVVILNKKRYYNRGLFEKNKELKPNGNCYQISRRTLLFPALFHHSYEKIKKNKILLPRKLLRTARNLKILIGLLELRKLLKGQLVFFFSKDILSR